MATPPPHRHRTSQPSWHVMYTQCTHTQQAGWHRRTKGCIQLEWRTAKCHFLPFYSKTFTRDQRVYPKHFGSPPLVHLVSPNPGCLQYSFYMAARQSVQLGVLWTTKNPQKTGAWQDSYWEALMYASQQVAAAKSSHASRTRYPGLSKGLANHRTYYKCDTDITKATPSVSGQELAEIQTMCPEQVHSDLMHVMKY